MNPAGRPSLAGIFCACFQGDAEISTGHVIIPLTSEQHLPNIVNMKHYTESDLRSALKKVRRFKTLSEIAADLGFSSSFISDVLAKRRPIGSKLAAALGYEKLTSCYIKKKGA